MIGVIVENWVFFDIAKDTPTKWRGAHMMIKSDDYDDFDHYHQDFYDDNLVTMVVMIMRTELLSAFQTKLL